MLFLFMTNTAIFRISLTVPRRFRRKSNQVWCLIEPAMRSNSDIALAILKALNELSGSAGAARVARKLAAEGYNVQPRTVRYYFRQLDEQGLTRLIGRRQGRQITPQGREELSKAKVIEKVGFVATRIDSLVYRMTFDLDTGEGTVIANVALIREQHFARALEEMKLVFARGLAMGSLLAIGKPGEVLADTVIPPGYIGLATICSVTVNGILLKKGIPITSRFGGMLEFVDAHPRRFIDLIEYRGTTLDPLELFITSNMTRVRECAKTGTGVIGASFREIPSVALDDLTRLRRKMQAMELSGIVGIGYPNQPLFGVPVSEGRTGLVVVGGLNPFAALREAGVTVTLKSLAGLVEYSQFERFESIRDRYPRI